MSYSYDTRKGGKVLNQIYLNLGFKNEQIVTTLIFSI